MAVMEEKLTDLLLNKKEKPRFNERRALNWNNAHNNLSINIIITINLPW